MQADRVDKSAVGFDYQGKTEKHESQKGLLGIELLCEFELFFCLVPVFLLIFSYFSFF